MQWGWIYVKVKGQDIGKVGPCTFTFALARVLAQKVQILTPVLAKAEFLLDKRLEMKVLRR